MNLENKKGIRWLLFRLFGPTELKNLVNYIDDAVNDHMGIVIYPLGEFPFEVRTSQENDLEPIIFPTNQERAAFLSGLEYGVNIMGGTTAALTKQQFDELDEMSANATHGDKKKSIN